MALVVSFVNVSPKRIPNFFQGFSVPAVDWKVWKPYPHWNFLRYIYFRVEIWSPSVEIQSLRSHEIRAISEDQVSIIFGYKLKNEEASPYGVASNTVLELGPPVPLDPVVCGFG